MFPGAKESVVIKANDASSSEPRIEGKFSISHGDNCGSEGFFFARSNVNIIAVSFNMIINSD
jgi:hypothetical protein